MAAFARLTKYFVLAGLALMLFVSFVSYFNSYSGHSIYTSPSGDILGGALEQNQGFGKPGPHKISDPAGVNDGKGVVSIPADNQPKVVVAPETKKKFEIYPVAPNQRSFEVKDDIVYDPKGPKANQIVLLMAGDGKGHNGGIPNLIAHATENRKEYAEYHGHIFHFINITKYPLPGNVHPVWKKLPSIVETFNTYPDSQWIWWLDLDAIIMDAEVELNERVLSHEAILRNHVKGAEFLADREMHTRVYTSRDPKVGDIDLIIAQDPNGLNAGSFFIRRSKFTKLLLDIWYDQIFQAATWDGKEQMALQHLAFNHPTIREHLGIVPQRILNAFSVGGKEMKWADGDLAVHMAGCWTQNYCEKSWNELWPKRKTAAAAKARKEELKLESERKLAEEKGTTEEKSTTEERSEEDQERLAESKGFEEAAANAQLRRTQEQQQQARYSSRTSKGEEEEDDYRA